MLVAPDSRKMMTARLRRLAGKMVKRKVNRC
jgi:hypothetical protein